jgi:hypothetical protein
MIAIVATVLTGSLVIMTQLYQIRTDLAQWAADFDKRMSIAEARLVLLPSDDHWRSQDMVIWSMELDDLNSELDVPDPRAVVRDRLQ